MLGTLGSLFARYRAYVVVVVAVAFLVVAGSEVKTGVSPSATAAVNAAGGGGAAPGGVADGPEAAALGPSASGAGQPAGAGRVGATRPISAGGPVAASGSQYPGVGTPAALANPNCDPATGRVRFPSAFAAECVVPWPAGADNGGATAQGVTKDSIRILVYENAADTEDAQRAEQKQIRDEIMLWANHIELWGRKLDIKFFVKSGTDEVAQRADAIQAASLKPFMATSLATIGIDAPPYVWSTELAARGIINWDAETTYAQTHAQAGYRWGAFLDDRMSALQIGEYIGKRVAGRPAKWAGDPTMTARPRVLGLLYDKNWDKKTFEEQLAKYAPGARLADAISFDPNADLAAQQEQATTVIARLKDKGVTTIIPISGIVYNAVLTRQATAQGFFPEWIITGWQVSDVILAGQVNDQQQWGHAFGPGGVQIEAPVAERERHIQYQWEYGREPEDAAMMGAIYIFDMYALNALQTAGPNLTPATYRDALFAQKPAGGAWCGCITLQAISFGRRIAAYPGDKYFATEDVTEKWWDPNTTSVNEIGVVAAGAMHWVNGGKRYQVGEWPTTDPDVFNPNNAPILMEHTPPQDRAPMYPHQPHKG